MARVAKVQITGPQAVGHRDVQDVTVTAEVEFSQMERDLGGVYYAQIVLYEIDGQMDVYSFQPNGQDLVVQHAPRRGKDDHVGLSDPIVLEASSGGTQQIRHVFEVRGDLDPVSTQMQLKAAVVCRPEFGTAIAWSDPLPMWTLEHDSPDARWH